MRTIAGVVSLNSLNIKFHIKVVVHVDGINRCKFLMKNKGSFSGALTTNQLNFSNMFAMLRIDKYLLDEGFNTMEIAFHI